MKRILNFSPGPAILPTSVLEEASRAVTEIDGTGMSILEVSHRSATYEKIQNETRERLLRLLGLSAGEYTVLFLGGGASLQFAMVPMNFLAQDRIADYAHTGDWSARAIKEAKRYGQVRLASSTESEKFSRIEKKLTLTDGAAYLHLTTNNTIEGTEWPVLPEAPSPLLADMSSDILARQLDHSRFSLIYAGAQKNLGPAGVTLVIARKKFLESANDDLPTMLSYKTHLKNDSLYNTPAVFPIYVTGLVLKWLEEQGGVAAMEKRNREKAAAIYQALDECPEVYDPTVTDPADRSLMNITFRLRDSSREEAFLAGAQALGMEGLRGHRSVGGFRASIYNAFPQAGCLALAEYLRRFAR